MTDDCWFPKVEPPGKKAKGTPNDTEYSANGKREWRSKDGRVLLLCDMDADHIRSCLKKIESIAHKGGLWRAEFVPWLYMELDFRQLIKGELGLSSGVRITPAIRKSYEEKRRGLHSVSNTTTSSYFFNTDELRTASSKLEKSNTEDLNTQMRKLAALVTPEARAELRKLQQVQYDVARDRFMYHVAIGVDSSVINLKGST